MFGFAITPLVQVAILAGTVMIGFGGGWRANEWRRDSIELEQKEADAKAALRRLDREDAKGAAFEKERVKIVKQFVPIKQEVERVVTKVEYRDVCLDDDGLRVLRSAIHGAEVSAGESVPAVPGPERAVQR